MIAQVNETPRRIRGEYLAKCREVKLVTNLHEVVFKIDTVIHMYAFKITPDIRSDNRKQLIRLLKAAQRDLNSILGFFVPSGRTLFAVGPKINTQALTVVLDSQGYEIALKHVKTVDLSEIYSDDKHKSGPVFSFFNNILKDFLRQLNYIEIGRSRKYFDPNSRKSLPAAGVMLFSGYATSFNVMEAGIFLRVDPALKIVRNQTVLQAIHNIYAQNGDKTKEEKRALVCQELQNKMVMANYGKSQYFIIEDVIFDATVDSHKFTSDQGVELSIAQYYKNAYNINITNRKQPLLKGTSGQKKKKIDIVLVPQLLLMSGLPQNFDERQRRDISDLTIVKPAEKLKQISNLMEELQKRIDPFSAQTLSQQLQIEFDTKLTIINAKILNTPSLHLGNRERIEQGKVANFNLFKQKIFDSSIQLKVCIVHPQSFDLTNFKDIFKSTCVNLGLKNNLHYSAIPFTDSRSSLKELQSITLNEKQAGTKAILFVLPSNFKSQYKNVKRLCLRAQIQMISQMALTSTLSKKNFASICTKILLQLSCKMGNKLWVPQINDALRKKGALLLGVDSSKDKERGNKTIVAYCSSVDADMSQFHSNYYVQERSNGLILDMRKIILQCVNFYVERCRRPPQQLIILKNGFSQKEVSFVFNQQIALAKETLSTYSMGKSAVALTYIAVDMNVLQKFFVQGRNGIENPPHGTLVNKGVVTKDYDFYLVPQQCNRGCAKPTYFKVLYSNSAIEEGLLEELMYVQCFNYMNWSGSIRTPGPLQYAKKLASFIGQYINSDSPVPDIDKHLYYI